jgi:hypothetical protein
LKYNTETLRKKKIVINIADSDDKVRACCSVLYLWQQDNKITKVASLTELGQEGEPEPNSAPSSPKTKPRTGTVSGVSNYYYKIYVE